MLRKLMTLLYIIRNGKVVHSGIVVGTNPIRIKSKWGQGCVWLHDKTSVPEVYKEPDGSLNVTYYRYSRVHDYEFTPSGSTKHRAVCSTCGYSEMQVHLFRNGTCIACGYVDNHFLWFHDDE